MMLATNNVESHTVQLSWYDLRMAAANFIRDTLRDQDPKLRDEAALWAGDDGFTIQWVDLSGNLVEKGLSHLDEEAICVTWRTEHASPVRRIEV